MNAHYDSKIFQIIKDKYIVVDTNILSASASDADYYKTFFTLFNDNPILIDPIVKLEFLRGAYREKTYKEKNEFLHLDRFFLMSDHQDIYKKTYDHAFNIARIYSHCGKPDVPLGDILITARLAIYSDYYFLTEDENDFSTLLFDRLTVFSFEKMRGKDKSTYLEHAQLLQFNHEKYRKCLKNLPT